MRFYEEVQENSIFSGSFKDTTKTITPCETRQNLLLTAPILIKPTVFSNRDIIMETTSVVKVSMALFLHFLPFFVVFPF